MAHNEMPIRNQTISRSTFIVPAWWKKAILNRLNQRREVVSPNGSPPLKYFKMPSSWIRNGDLIEEKFRLLDEIESRGERGNPVKIYESTNPKLQKYLYIRRTNSYSIWRVPRPDISSSQGRVVVSHPSSRMVPHQSPIPSTVHVSSDIIMRISSLPSDMLDRLVRLNPSTLDHIERMRPDMWTRLLAASTQDAERVPQRPRRLTRPGVRRSMPVANPSDRGDGLLRPSRIPIPISTLRRPAPLQLTSPMIPPRVAAASLNSSRLSESPTPSQLSRPPEVASPSTSASPTTPRLSPVSSHCSRPDESSVHSATASPASPALSDHASPVQSPLDVGPPQTTTASQTSPCLLDNLSVVTKTAPKNSTTQTEETSLFSFPRAFPRVPPIPRVAKPITPRRSANRERLTRPSKQTDKWWHDDLAISPRLMKVEAIMETAVEIRRDEDGELTDFGEGTFSIVYAADLSQYGRSCFVALKKFKRDLATLKEVKKEAGYLRVLADSGFVPHLFGYLPSCLALVLECFGQGTTLEDLLSAAHVFGLPLATWVNISVHIAVAVQEFLKRGVLHNDIKTENILVDWKLPDYPIKFIDFGRATYKTGYIFTKTTFALAKRSQLAPELNFSTQTSPASEIYSLGVVLDAIAQKGHVHPLEEIAESCTRQNPISRPDINTVVRLLDSAQLQLIH